MRIAQIAPLYESVPPKLYGGTERVVSYLTEELVQQGHDVTLFASGDSTTDAKLIPVVSRALRLDRKSSNDIAAHILMLERVLSEAHAFDVLHFHVDCLHFPFSRRHRGAQVSTLHGRLDLPHLSPLYDEYVEIPVVSISDAQRSPLPQALWSGTINHGLPLDLYSAYTEPGDYFAFLGRISPEKRVDRAIEIAKALETPIKIAAKVDKGDVAYFESAIRPLLDHPLVEFIGEIGERDKPEFLGRARALLFTIDWPEPFGLVMIEAMACGTPVIAFRRGSVPEVVDHGITGIIVDDMQEAVAAAAKVHELDRRRCRAVFEQRFTATRMAAEYVELYRALVQPDRIPHVNGTNRQLPITARWGSRV